MDFENQNIEVMLADYFSGKSSDKDRAVIETWRTESCDNEEFFQEYRRSWEAVPLLKEMEQFNSFEALLKINSRISGRTVVKLWSYLYKAAAILILPLIIYSGYVTIQIFSNRKTPEKQLMMETVSARQGMVSQFSLADGTKVWLNSGSELQFPTSFTGTRREVKLKGEAFFEVKKDPNQPFRVDTKNLHIDDIGTSFNVASYEDEPQAEVILVEGEVKLSQGTVTKKDFVTMHPGELAVYKENDSSIEIKDVDVDKYIAWRDGNLMFRDDSMEEVVKRLSRWFNIQIVINDPEIKNYAYRATFRNENLAQVLNLLKISAPIDYQIIDSKMLPNGEYTKQKVYIMKKKK